MKKVSLIVVAVCLVLFMGCSGRNQTTGAKTEKQTPKNLVIASGNTGGTFYYIAAGQSKIITENIEGISFATEATASPIENNTFASDDVNVFAMTPLDALVGAYEGDKEKGYSEPLDNLRLVMAGHRTTVHYVTLKNSGINSFNDIKGKRVGTFSKGNSGYYITEALFAEYGIGPKDYTALPMTASEMSDALKDGAIDVAMMSAGAPAAAVTDLNTSKDIHLISIDNDKIKAFNEKYQYWRVDVLPSGTYSDVKVDTNVVTFPVVLACNADLDEEIVYQVTKVLNENTSELTKIHQNGADWNTKNSLEQFANPLIPFHPGAARYYREVK